MHIIQTSLLRALALGAIVLALPSCNIFSPIDSPSGDDQLLSAARACFDKGDFECARRYYGKVGTSADDQANAEEAYAILDEQGAGMANFLAAFANASGGKSITKLANLMMTTGAGPSTTRREQIFAAYAKTKSITAGSATQGMVKFIAGAAFLAELLGEMAKELNATSVGPTVIASNPTTCQAADITTCVAAAACAKATGSSADSGATSYNLDTLTTVSSITLDLQLVKAATNAILAGLTTLGAGGSFSSVSGFADAFDQFNPIDNTTPTGTNCFRMTLLQQGIGVEN